MVLYQKTNLIVKIFIIKEFLIRLIKEEIRKILYFIIALFILVISID